MKKALIIGSGFAGATSSRFLAESNFNIDLIERRNHIGGNSYSYKDVKTGIEIHKYGPHIFHTNSKMVYEFITQFTKFSNFVNRVKAEHNGRIYSLPINLHTINQFFGKAMSPNEAKNFIESKRVKIEKATNFKEFILNSIGWDLYEAFFKNYTIKQWGIKPEKIQVSTAKRLSIRYNYNDNYFDDKFQGIPIGGYGKLFENMLDHKNITIHLNTPFDEKLRNLKNKYDLIIFTGSIDEYYNYKYGYLPYRGVRFEEIRGNEIQGNAVINYTDMTPKFTRIHEHKYFTPDKYFKNSIAFREFSNSANNTHDRYYPIVNDASQKIFEKYIKHAKKEKNVVFLGRLGKFKYYNMDQVVETSINCIKKIIGR